VFSRVGQRFGYDVISADFDRVGQPSVNAKGFQGDGRLRLAGR
jgi:hypothetical protein